ncbi:MAG: TadE family protein [Pseudomonadota bacterium]
MTLGGVIRCERGVAAVEFAIVSVVLMTLLIGGIDMGRTFYVKNQLSFLADRAARAVLVDPDVTDAALQATLAAEFTAGDSSLLAVNVSAQTVSGIDFRVIQIDYPMALFVPFLNYSSLALNVNRRVPTG